jgi:nucleoside-triphosphatase THEP1
MALTTRERFIAASKNLLLFPLQTEGELKRFHVSYDTETLTNLQQLVEESPVDQCKIILTGHTGCGKSTLLAELAKSYEQDFFVSIFSIADTIENADVNHINILFAIGLKLLEKAEHSDINIEAYTNAKKSFLSWFAKKTKTEITSLEGEAGVGINLLNIINLKLKADSSIRTEIKEEFKNKISELGNKINEIAAVIEAVEQKKVLVIIDDIDKLDLAVVKEIFHNNIKSLFLPQFRVIYTLPISAIRDKDILPILVSETNDQIVPMCVLKMYAKGESHKSNPKPEDEALERLRKIILLRLDPDLITPDALESLLIYSGGVLRELVRIANTCCRVCLRKIRQDPNNPDLIITIDILRLAVNEIRIQMSGVLRQSDFEILQQVYHIYDPKNAQSDNFLGLLKSLSVIEYINDRCWYDVHPIVVDLLAERGMLNVAPSP